MESRLNYAIAVVALASLAVPSNVLALEREHDAGAELTDDGIREWIEGEVGGERRAGGAGGGGSTCAWSVVPYPYTGAEPPASVGEPPTPEHALYLVYCDGEYVVTQWLGPRDPTPDAMVDSLLVQLVRDLPIGAPDIGVRPETRGVTGIPSLFWVEGYRGETITDGLSDDATGITVEVEVVLGNVVWDFGDGTPVQAAGLGEPWPERSSVEHAYRDRGDLTITVTLTLPARFRVNGGAWRGLEDITRTATIPYVVEEVQAVRNR